MSKYQIVNLTIAAVMLALAIAYIVTGRTEFSITIALLFAFSLSLDVRQLRGKVADLEARR